MSLGDKQLKYVEPTQYIPATSMSKREFFAGLAMQGILASHNAMSYSTAESIAEASCEYSDELIKQLEK